MSNTLAITIVTETNVQVPYPYQLQQSQQVTSLDGINFNGIALKLLHLHIIYFILSCRNIFHYK